MVLSEATKRAVSEAQSPSSNIARFGEDAPLHLDAGVSLSPFQIAYETYGELNENKSNAVLICHALTGDQYCASVQPVTQKPGWWETLIGPGKPIDTDRYFVICSNVLGGCLGTTGPASINEKTGKPYGLDFPIVTIADMVRAQSMLIDYLQIDTLFAGHWRIDGRHAGSAMGSFLSGACICRHSYGYRCTSYIAEYRVS